MGNMMKFSKWTTLTALMTVVTIAASLLGPTGLCSAQEAQQTVPLGSAATFAILASSTITNDGSSVINGDLGLSPGTAVTGFPPGIVNGTQHVTDDAAAQAQTDLASAYSDAAGREPFTTVATLGGLTPPPGVYHSGAALSLTGVLTLEGDANAVWIFQAGSTLDTAADSQVILSGGANAANVYWTVGSSATLGANSVFKGNILAGASITLYDGAALVGRALAHTAAVTLNNNIVTIPSFTLTPDTGTPGTVITVSGSGFTPTTAGIVFFDTNGNSIADEGEPQTTVMTTATGAFPDGIILTVPGTGAGTYPVRADVPSGDTPEAAADFTVSNEAPTVSAVGLYQTNYTTEVTAMTPQTEYAVKITVTDSNSLNDLDMVKVTIFYDENGTYAPEDVPTSGITQTVAILTCIVGTTPSWSIDPDPSTGTTWSIISGSCVQPALTDSSGDFWFHFKPGKVATATTGNARWHIYAKATDKAAATGDSYQDNRTMDWYGEITVNTESINFGSVALGSDFSANLQTGISITYICNGTYSQQVKSSSPWSNNGNSVILNAAGIPGSGEFSLKADDTADIGSAVLVSTSYVIIGTGTQTSESGKTETACTLWLKLGVSGIHHVQYSGTINYGITQ